MKDFILSFYFDRRYKNKEGKHNLRLSIYNKNIKEASKRRKMYSTPFWFIESEWDKISSFQEIKSGRKTNEYKEAEKVILPILKAMEIFMQQSEEKAESLPVFSFEAFERIQNKEHNSNSDLISDYYNKAILRFNNNDQIGTASNYDSSLKSLLEFRKYKGYDYDFSFIEVSFTWLNEYERWMRKNERSNATIGIYLRPLRALFNLAIEDGIIKPKQYPFHNRDNKDGYKIPSSRKVKKALSIEDLQTLYNVSDLTQEEEKARDFFFFSYLSNGMNVKDIALLKWQNISGSEFSFIRAKTANTTKENQTPIIVTVLDFHKEIFEKYGSPKIKGDYIFSIVNKNSSASEQKRKINAFTRFINQHIKKVAERNNITDEISTYWARHSFASQLMNSNTSPEFIKQSLGHNSLITTNNYLSGFSTNIKEEKANSLFNNLKK